MSFGPAGQVHLAGRDHGGDAAVHRASRSSRAGSGAASSRRTPDARGCRSGPARRRSSCSRSRSCAPWRCRSPSRLPTATISAVVHDDGVGVEDRLVDVARQQQADVADDDLARLAGGWRLLPCACLLGCGCLSARVDLAQHGIDHERLPSAPARPACRGSRRGRPTACSGSTGRSSPSPRSSGRRRAPPGRRGTASAATPLPARAPIIVDRRRRILRARAATCAMWRPLCRFSVLSSVMNSGFLLVVAQHEADHRASAPRPAGRVERRAPPRPRSSGGRCSSSTAMNRPSLLPK